MSTESPVEYAADLASRRVLHVVQKYSSGVGSAIAQYTHSLPEMEHHLLSATAVDAEGDLAEQADFAGTHRMHGNTLTKIRRIREVVQELRPDVVHAHSSHAGAYTRLAVSRTHHHLVYTPHCYAFERRDLLWPVRYGYWAAEAILALNTSAFAACAHREWELSEWATRRAPRHVVPNIAPPVTSRADSLAPGAPVAGGGRLSPQKDPAFFLAAVRLLRTTRPALRAVWIGDGDAHERRALERAGVEVTGWLPRKKALDVLAGASLYLHSARWEGFPLMVAEAAAVQVPTLVRRLPCFADVPTQLTIDERDVEAALACLEDPAAASANVSGWAEMLASNTMTQQRAALLTVYRAGIPTRSGASPVPTIGSGGRGRDA
jgi:glycosyltransferase involved in cell wall biosynthesis